MQRGFHCSVPQFFANTLAAPLFLKKNAHKGRVFLIRPPAPLASEAVANSFPSADECVRVGAYIRGFFLSQIDNSILPFS